MNNKEQSGKRPNILLIITDSQGHNILGETGVGHISTPNIDKLAREGISFSRAYNTSPVCTPARAGLFTGTYPHNAGAWGNDIPLGTTAKTMGEYFSKEGYRSAYIGKWHLDGTDYFGTGIPASGYEKEYWFDGRNYLDRLPEDERQLWRTGLPTADSIDEHGITREWTWAGQITDRAIKFLESWKQEQSPGNEQPYFMVASYDEPHGPSVCPAPFNRMYEGFNYPLPENCHYDRREKPEPHRIWAEQFSFPDEGINSPLYFGASSFVDDEIGKLIHKTDEIDLDNTVTIFTTDHGHYLGAHHLDGKGPCLYEEVIKVPLVFRGKNIPREKKCESLISHIDVLPTLLSMSGIPVPEILEGINQSPVIEDPTTSQREWVLSEFHRFSISHDSWFGFHPVRCLITKDFKLTVNAQYKDEFYVFTEDPGEMVNRIDAPEYEDIRNSMHRRLLECMNESRDPFRGPLWEKRSWAKQELLNQQGMGGERRPRKTDPFLPDIYNYNTGGPATEQRKE